MTAAFILQGGCTFVADQAGRRRFKSLWTLWGAYAKPGVIEYLPAALLETPFPPTPHGI